MRLHGCPLGSPVSSFFVLKHCKDLGMAVIHHLYTSLLYMLLKDVCVCVCVCVWVCVCVCVYGLACPHPLPSGWPLICAVTTSGPHPSYLYPELTLTTPPSEKVLQLLLGK
jgi:hypothetical protein